MCCLQETPSYLKDTMRRWKKVVHGNENQKKVRLAILISDKIEFEIKTDAIRTKKDVI